MQLSICVKRACSALPHSSSCTIASLLCEGLGGLLWGLWVHFGPVRHFWTQGGT